MRYLGGKSRIAKQLAEAIDRYRQPGQLVWDAFCGGLSMSVALSKNGPVWSTDACVPLISLYQAVQNGWSPPTEVSKDTWQAAKSLPDTDPMKAFCGFAGSFGGKWFGGYVDSDRAYVVKRASLSSHAKAGDRQRQRPYAAAARDLPRDLAGLRVDLVDFLAVEPQPTAALLYLDPPYAGTTGYGAMPRFDDSKFVERVRGWSRFTHCFVSEYSFPIGECVWERTLKTGLQGADNGNRALTERLYHLHPGNLK